MHRQLPKRPVPKVADIVVQIHFHPSGKAEVDQSSIGMTFTDRPGTSGRVAMILVNRRIDIAPNDSHYVVKTSMEIPSDYVEQILSPGATLEDLPPELTEQAQQGLTRAFNAFDANHDGKLSAAESAAIIQYLRQRR